MGAAAAAAAKAVGPQLSSVTLIIRHRVFHDFVERSQVRLKQDFPIGASDYSARVTEFVPDFDMDLKTRKVTSRSVEPKNPAFHIVVREKGAPVDTTWAFLHLPPHFTRKSLLAFQVQRIDFVGRPAIVAADSGLSPPDGAATKARKP